MLRDRQAMQLEARHRAARAGRIQMEPQTGLGTEMQASAPKRQSKPGWHRRAVTSQSRALRGVCYLLRSDFSSPTRVILHQYEFTAGQGTSSMKHHSPRPKAAVAQMATVSQQTAQSTKDMCDASSRRTTCSASLCLCPVTDSSHCNSDCNLYKGLKMRRAKPYIN